MSVQTRKRAIEEIVDPVKRRNSKSKRSKNIMKKAQELSVLCKVDVNISIYDSKMRKVTEFATNPNLSIKDLGLQINDNKIKHKLITSKELGDKLGSLTVCSKLLSDSMYNSDDENEENSNGPPQYMAGQEFGVS